MITEFFIRRPVLTTLLMSALVLFGIVAYQKLPVSDLPNVDFPTIQVSANLPGASPETMASAVATPLERQFTTIEGIDSMTSTSALGLTQITVQFSLDRDIDGAAQDIQAAITKSLRLLPAEMPTPPTYQKVNPADQPIIFLPLSSPTLPLYVVDEYAQTNLAQQLSTISGVAQVSVFGSQKYAVRVQADPKKLEARDMSLEDVERAVSGANVTRPTGTLQGKRQSFSIQTNGQLETAEEFRNIITTWRKGAPIRLGDLASVIDDVQTDRLASWFSGTRAVILAVQRQPGTNTIQIIDKIRELLPKFREQLPAQITLDVLFDRSIAIRHSVDDVKFTLVLTVGLVILVIFVFLRNLSATIIPSLAVPISIIGTFAVMDALGYSIDLLSLMAMTLSVGFVVDDAVVVLENIVRHMEAGMPRMQAALLGSKEVAFTVISMTISLAAVFIPILFMGGVMGRLLHEFAVVIGTSVVISGIVSLTLTPMLCSRFLSPPSHTHGLLYRMMEWVFVLMNRVYAATLRFVLRHKWLATLALIGSFVGTVQLFAAAPKGFIPNEDVGFIFGFTEASQDISFESMREHQLKIAKIVGDDPNVDAYMSSVGAGGPNVVPNTGRVFIRLKPRAQRGSAAEVIAAMRPKLSSVPGISVYLQELPTIRLGGNLSKALYQVTLQGMDLDELTKWAPIMTDKMRLIPDLTDVNSDLQLAAPKAVVDVDRDRAASLGIGMDQVEATLGGAYGSRQSSTIYTSTNQFYVITELDPKYQREPEQLPNLRIRSKTGAMVPLASIAKIRRDVGPLTIAHLGQLPAVTISFNLKPGVALSQAVDQINAMRDELKVPDTLHATFQGTAQAFQSSLGGQGMLLIITLVLIYIVLGILYESFIHPITILSGLPSGAIGALLALVLFKMELNVYGFVGLIMLVGIVKKNAIMMIDFAIEAQRTGLTPEQAIYQGCLLRFRPIMMTTMAALFGTLPIALALGAGTESRQPLGVAVVGGLIVSQFLTLYITPALYVQIESLKGFFGRRRKPPAVAGSASEG